jgi:hypothetical protein
VKWIWLFALIIVLGFSSTVNGQSQVTILNCRDTHAAEPEGPNPGELPTIEGRMVVSCFSAIAGRSENIQLQRSTKSKLHYLCLYRRPARGGRWNKVTCSQDLTWRKVPHSSNGVLYLRGYTLSTVAYRTTRQSYYWQTRSKVSVRARVNGQEQSFTKLFVSSIPELFYR